MNATQNTRQHVTTMLALLTRMQTAATMMTSREATWGDATQMKTALEYTVYAAFALGVISEDEARKLGFPC